MQSKIDSPNRKSILCTLGPSSLNKSTIRQLSNIGVSLFRINLSHASIDTLAETIAMIQTWSDVPVCLDSEGAQVRTGAISGGSLELISGKTAILVGGKSNEQIAGNSTLPLTPLAALSQIENGDFVSVDFNGVLLQVIQHIDTGIQCRVLVGGKVGTCKGVNVNRHIDLPAITEKDRAAIDIGLQMGIRHYALSFASNPNAVAEMRSLVGEGATIISKIETREALHNLEAIAKNSNAILIDRGDLSREIALEQIPVAQKSVIVAANKWKIPVYVATNLLESMVNAPEPTRAEVCDIYNALEDGADGLVLAAETAIGRHPVRCAAMIRRVVQVWEEEKSSGNFLLDIAQNQIAGNWWLQGIPQDLNEFPVLRLSNEQLMDAEMLALGGFSPVFQFMNKPELLSVVENCKTSQGQPWTLPILLQVSEAVARALPDTGYVALSGSDGVIRSVLELVQKFTLNLNRLAKGIYNTNSVAHPGVDRFINAGNVCLAGKVYLVQHLNFPEGVSVFSPSNARILFAKKGWNRIVGFHTRNPPHRGHEHIQVQALEQSDSEGLFLSPLAGVGRKGDFRPEVVFKCYQRTIERGVYPDNTVALAALACWPRFAGPREAVFSAMVRRNFGCTHFIVGRDHSGVGDFYGPDDVRNLFDQLGEIGIEPIHFDAVTYDENSHGYGSGQNSGREISGTLLRKHAVDGTMPPSWLVRPEVPAVLDECRARGEPLFVN
jgi:pyruvate kinase